MKLHSHNSVVTILHFVSLACANPNGGPNRPIPRHITDFRYPHNTRGAGESTGPASHYPSRQHQPLGLPLLNEPLSHHAPVAAVLLGFVERLVGAGHPLLHFLVELELRHTH